ncbi:MAG: sulfotransferase [Methylococcales bacterium]|nr:sulfotransferase [Methylococcales bacterium]
MASNGISESTPPSPDTVNIEKTGKSAPTLIVVLGMHRSGTSVVTRSLQILGVELGNHLMPGHESGNIKGYWEDLDINALNIEMQQAIGGDWHYLSAMGRADLQLLVEQGFLKRAVQLLRGKTAGHRLFGIKDPRFARLMPFWQRVFKRLKYRVHYVFAIRNPLSVVRSLAVRDGFDRQKCYLLWLAHTLEILAHTRNRPVALVEYDNLLADPDGQIRRLAAAMQLTVDPVQLEIYLREFLDAELRHSQYRFEDLADDPDCPELVLEIYPLLREMTADAIDRQDAGFMKKQSNWCKTFQSWAYPLKLLDSQYAVMAEQNGQVAEYRQRNHELNLVLQAYAEQANMQ